MSGIESAAKPLLEKVIVGEGLDLRLADQAALARWIALKTMVLDQSRETKRVFTNEQLAEFRTTQTPPEGMRIWLFHSIAPEWSAKMRQTGHLFGTSMTERPRGPLSQNTRSLTLGFGNLLTFVLFSQIENFERYATIDFGGPAAFPLWPSRIEVFSWPPPSALTVEGANFVSETLDRFGDSPMVKVPPSYSP